MNIKDMVKGNKKIDLVNSGIKQKLDLSFQFQLMILEMEFFLTKTVLFFLCVIFESILNT